MGYMGIKKHTVCDKLFIYQNCTSEPMILHYDLTISFLHCHFNLNVLKFVSSLLFNKHKVLPHTSF